MNSVILELYELSDAMSFLESSLDGMAANEDRQLTGNAYIIGLFGRRLAEIAERLEKEPGRMQEHKRTDNLATPSGTAR